jgi:iron-sulfur cluster repair protein YtfE (RIC family)
MGASKDKVNLLSRMVIYHEDVEKLDEQFHAIITALSGNSFEKTKARLKELIIIDLANHFSFEETIVFPMVKAWAKSVRENSYNQLINGYLETHRKLLTEASKVQCAFESLGDSVTKEALFPVIAAFAQLNKNICIHAKNENEHIVSVLKKNPTLQFLMSRKKLST